MPYKDNTAYCNMCDGPGGSPLWTIDPSRAESFVQTGVHSFGSKCQRIYDFGTKYQAFTAKQCPTIQANTMNKCGCALRDSHGKAIKGTGGGGSPQPTCKKLNGNCKSQPCCPGFTCKSYAYGKLKFCKPQGRRNLRADGEGEAEAEGEMEEDVVEEQEDVQE